MCDCGTNIFNDNNDDIDTVYSCINIGSGSGIFTGSTVIFPNETFNFKTLVAGTNVNLSSDSSTITISSTDTGVTTLSNNGGGAAVGQNITGATLNLRTLVSGTNINVVQGTDTVSINNTITPITGVTNLGTGQPVLVDVLGNNVRARTLVGQNGLSVNASGNEVNLSDEQIQSLSNIITYNYGQIVNNVDLALSYNSPSGVASNTIFQPENVAGVVTSTGVTTLDYQTGPRYNLATDLYFQTNANNGTTSNSLVKLQPNTTVTNDYTQDYILGLATDNNLYQINLSTFTENIMRKYNTDVLSLSPTPDHIAMSPEDAILFFSSGDEIYSYDFCSDITTLLFNVTSLAGWNASMRYMYYSRSTLYLLDKDYKFWPISIKPFDRNLSATIPYGTAYYCKYSFTGDMFTFAINDESGLPIITNDNAGTTRISMSSTIGASNTGTEFQFNTMENNTSRYIPIFAASGRLYVFSPDSVKFYRFDYGTSVENAAPGLFSPVNTYLSLTRSPYGIIS